MKRPSGFLWKNPWKKETLLTYYYSAIFRMQLLLLPPGKLRKGWGRENEESAGTASREGYRQAARIARIVGKVCDKTPWESKCLVRALAAQRLLCRRHHSCNGFLTFDSVTGNVLTDTASDFVFNLFHFTACKVFHGRFSGQTVNNPVKRVFFAAVFDKSGVCRYCVKIP